MPKLCIAVVLCIGFAYFISPLLLTRTTYRSSSFRFVSGIFDSLDGVYLGMTGDRVLIDFE
jgi:hypothetical protein